MIVKQANKIIYFLIFLIEFRNLAIYFQKENYNIIILKSNFMVGGDDFLKIYTFDKKNRNYKDKVKSIADKLYTSCNFTTNLKLIA